MSEKQQGTSAGMRERMFDRYGNELTHKHDKNHLQYRKHFKTHPNDSRLKANGEDFNTTPTGNIRKLKLTRIRKRLAKRSFH